MHTLPVIWLLGVAFAAPPAAPAPDVERMDTFAIEARGQLMAGPALVSASGGRITLIALTPAGTALFEVVVAEGEAVTSSPDPELAVALARIPFARDLTALYRYTCDVKKCRADRWRLVRTGEGWSVRGPGGRARMERHAEGWRLHDRRRGYTLTVVPGR